MAAETHAEERRAWADLADGAVMWLSTGVVPRGSAGATAATAAAAGGGGGGGPGNGQRQGGMEEEDEGRIVQLKRLAEAAEDDVEAGAGNTLRPINLTEQPETWRVKDPVGLPEPEGERRQKKGGEGEDGAGGGAGAGTAAGKNATAPNSSTAQLAEEELLYNKRRIMLQNEARTHEANRKVILTFLLSVFMTLHGVCHLLGAMFIIPAVPFSYTTTTVLVGLMYSLGGCAWVLYYWLLYADPGHLEKRPYDIATRPSLAALAAAERHGGGGITFCQTCHVWRPMRAKHCRQCGHCSYRLDHHCIWIGNCVGMKNHFSFFVFLVLENAHLLLGHFLLLSHAYAHADWANLLTLASAWKLLTQGPFWWFAAMPSSVWILTVLFIPSMFLFLLLSSQYRNISGNMLVNEVVNKHRYSHFKDGNPFDRGGYWANWREFYDIGMSQTSWIQSFKTTFGLQSRRAAAFTPVYIRDTVDQLTHADPPPDPVMEAAREYTESGAAGLIGFMPPNTKDAADNGAKEPAWGLDAIETAKENEYTATMKYVYD